MERQVLACTGTCVDAVPVPSAESNNRANSVFQWKHHATLHRWRTSDEHGTTLRVHGRARRVSTSNREDSLHSKSVKSRRGDEIAHPLRENQGCAAKHSGEAAPQVFR